LTIRENDRILLVACGTGQSFGLLQERLKGTGRIIGIDSSDGMLRQARKRICQNDWHNIQVLQLDATELSVDLFRKTGLCTRFDVVLGELAFSVVPEWKKVMEKSVFMLKSGGEMGMLDWYRPSDDMIACIVNWCAESDISRDIESYAQQLLSEYRTVDRFFFDSVYVGRGVK
jgi:ubiquinone/menaquinone biosynthesis C-methylase UbiE